MTETYLVYDSETSGLPLFHEPSDDPRQPHIVQLAALLVDERGHEIARMDRYVKPEGWTFEPAAVAAHGITEAKATELGIAEPACLNEFNTLVDEATVRVAFNDPFDARILRIAKKRYEGVDAADTWKAFPAICVMRQCTDICRIPPTGKMMKAGFKKFKNPKLEEAHQIIFGEPMENAHNALADVEATLRIFFELQRREREAATEAAEVEGDAA